MLLDGSDRAEKIESGWKRPEIHFVLCAHRTPICWLSLVSARISVLPCSNRAIIIILEYPSFGHSPFMSCFRRQLKSILCNVAFKPLKFLTPSFAPQIKWVTHALTLCTPQLFHVQWATVKSVKWHDRVKMASIVRKKTRSVWKTSCLPPWPILQFFTNIFYYSIFSFFSVFFNPFCFFLSVCVLLCALCHSVRERK